MTVLHDFRRLAWELQEDG